MKAARRSQLKQEEKSVGEDKRLKGMWKAWPVAAALAAGLGLRLGLLGRIFEVNGDSVIYGQLARNLLEHGRYALSGAGGELYPTLIRLPGYPLFLAACFSIFGMENYVAAAGVQIGLELAGCLLLADFVRRMAPEGQKKGAALATLYLAALCPFTASYAVLPLAETPTLFSIALALWALARFWERAEWWSALAFTAAVTGAALLRPDGALVGAALIIPMAQALRRSGLTGARKLRMALACGLLMLLPFAAWTARNWRVFHVFEPLAPRQAIDPDETPYPGWESWVKTWCLDFISTDEIYWNVPDGPLDATELPARAFDSGAERAETVALADDYNRTGYRLTPDLDARFARLAAERDAAHPLRSHLLLPLGRLADMTLRPRVENLNIDLDWWVYAHHHAETEFSWAYGGLNAVYLLLGLGGLCIGARICAQQTNLAKRDLGSCVWVWMGGYLVLRSALLLTVSAPETRYTLEFFPILCAAGGLAIYRLTYVVLELVLKLKASRGCD